MQFKMDEEGNCFIDLIFKYRWEHNFLHHDDMLKHKWYK